MAFVVRVRGPDWLDGETEVEVAALADGEHRELTIAVPIGGDTTYHGLVIDRTSREPCAGVSVDLIEDGKTLHTTSTDLAGHFQIRLRFENDLELRLHVDQFGEVLGRVERGHETPDDAGVFVLGRAAALIGTVTTQEGRPLSDAEIFVSGFREHMFQPPNLFALPSRIRPGLGEDAIKWSVRTTASGGYSIADLPSAIPLHAVAVREVDRLATGWVEIGALSPGEERRLDLRAGPMAELRGRVVDQEGEPARALTLWLVAAKRAGDRYLLRAVDEQEGSVVTDEDGSFAFEEVLPGEWLVGPEPGPAETGFEALFGSLFGGAAEQGEHGFAPWGTYVDIRLGEMEHKLDLVLARGLYLTGRVIDDQGKPARGANVSARTTHPGVSRAARTEEDGTFAIGPVIAIPHEVYASHGGQADSDRITVNPGEPVLLQLGRLGGGIAGLVMYGGKPMGGVSVLAHRLGSDLSYLQSTNTASDGTFLFARLQSGAYGLSAQTEDGLLGILPSVAAADNADAQQVQIDLQDAGRVRVWYLGNEALVIVTARVAGVVTTSALVSQGSMTTLRAPIGAATIEVHGFEYSSEPPLLLAKTEVVVRSGELLEVELR
jgi:protocatechuate 3,4-dioxygenase beta subunit